MLFLVFADGDMCAFKGENIRRLQNGICIKPNRSALCILTHLIFELGHAVQPSRAGDAI